MHVVQFHPHPPEGDSCVANIQSKGLMALVLLLRLGVADLTHTDSAYFALNDHV